MWPVVAGSLAGCCWPYETRPLTEPESRVVDRLCGMIADHARRSEHPDDLAVSQAIEAARREGRILAFEDDRRPRGDRKHGAVVMGRLYLHESLLDGGDSLRGRRCPYPLMMLYHEGVHLTQSTCLLIFSPGAAEHRAERESYRFAKEWERGGR